MAKTTIRKEQAGIPKGGATSDVLTKNSNADYDVSFQPSSGGGGGPTLQTNGTPNGDQTLLNLAEGVDINLTDNGTGTVTIDIDVLGLAGDTTFTTALGHDSNFIATLTGDSTFQSDVNAFVTGGGTNIEVTNALAGEDISGAATPQACFIGDDTSDAVSGTTAPQNQPLGQDQSFKSQKLARKFTVSELSSINEVTFTAWRSGSVASATYKVHIQGDSGGIPDGTDIITTGSLPLTFFTTAGGGANHTDDFSSAGMFQPATDYWIIFETVTPDTGDWNIKFAGSTDGGTEGFAFDTGSGWTLSGANSEWLQVQERVVYTGGQIWLSDANVTNRNKYDVMVDADYNLGNTIPTADRMGELTGFTSLSPGTVYHISSTRGAITTGGSVVVGKALTATKLLVDRSA